MVGLPSLPRCTPQFGNSPCGAFFSFSPWRWATVAAAGVLVVAACTSTATADREPTSPTMPAPGSDGGLVGPAEAGVYDAGASAGPEPDCTMYCDAGDGQLHRPARAVREPRRVPRALPAPPAGRCGRHETNTARLPPVLRGQPGPDQRRATIAWPPGRSAAASAAIAASRSARSRWGRARRMPDLRRTAATPTVRRRAPAISYLDGGVDGGGERPDGPKTRQHAELPPLPRAERGPRRQRLRRPRRRQRRLSVARQRLRPLSACGRSGCRRTSSGRRR